MPRRVAEKGVTRREQNPFYSRALVRPVSLCVIEEPEDPLYDRFAERDNDFHECAVRSHWISPFCYLDSNTTSILTLAEEPSGPWFGRQKRRLGGPAKRWGLPVGAATRGARKGRGLGSGISGLRVAVQWETSRGRAGQHGAMGGTAGGGTDGAAGAGALRHGAWPVAYASRSPATLACSFHRSTFTPITSSHSVSDPSPTTPGNTR